MAAWTSWHNKTLLRRRARIPSLARRMTARWLKGILFGVEPGNPLLLAGAAAVLLGAALAATLRPSLRAARVDPMSALRRE